MTNIGISRSSYYASQSIGVIRNDLQKIVSRIGINEATEDSGNQSSRLAMRDSFRIDVSATSGAIKNMSRAQNYLATSIAVLDNASLMLSRLHSLSILAANGSNSEYDSLALDAEAERISDRFHALMSTSNYRGKELFQDASQQLNLAANGHGSSLTYGVNSIDYDFLYDYTNPGVQTTQPGIKYEVKSELTDNEKDAIIAQTTGITRDDLVVGFQFTTNVNGANNGPGLVTDDLYYLDGEGAVSFDSNGTLTTDEIFNGGSFEIAFTNNGEASDDFNLGTNGNFRVNNGVITYNDPQNGPIEIGQIVSNGQDGSSLKIDFYEDASIPGTSNLLNGDFSNGNANWNIYNQRVDFGSTFTVNGVTIPTPSDADMQQFNLVDVNVAANNVGSYTPNPDDDANAPPLNFQASTANGYLNLATGNFSFSSEGGAILHGPAAVSDTFAANQGDFLKLDYRADGRGDWYHVAGYLVDESNNITYALKEYGKTTNGWISASVEVPTSGNYRFVFVNGTWDWSQGRYAGADFNIDNIRAELPFNITSDIVQDLLRDISYSSSNNNQASVKDVRVTASTKNNTATFVDDSKIFNTEFNGSIMLAPTRNLEDQLSLGSSNSLGDNFSTNPSVVTERVERAQRLVSDARVAAGSQYAAITMALESTTDLRDQYTISGGAMSDINFSIESVALTKKRIMEDFATAMLAQANKAQEGILLLVK